MGYSLVFKRKLFGVIKIKDKFQNIQSHSFPTDFNNNHLLFLIKENGDRIMVNIDRYDSYEIPGYIFNRPNNTNAIPKPRPIDKEQQKLLDRI